MKSKHFSLFVILLIFMLINVDLIAQKVSTESLLKELTDMKRLSKKEKIKYKILQFSSYDRHSVHPNKPGWFGNSDGFGGESIPGFEKVLKEPGKDHTGTYLICDLKGPGAIVRLWTAAITGDVDVYIDTDKEALYSGPAQKFFQQTYQALWPDLSDELLETTISQNTAAYYPIPFANSCKIVWRGDIKTLHFYHVNVRMYEKGSHVKSFRKSDMVKHQRLISAIAKTLDEPINQEFNQESFFHLNTKTPQRDILIKGTKAIKKMGVKVLSENLTEALRSTLMRIYFDGASKPQVEVPLGDFFGAAPGINPYHSLPLEVHEDGLMLSQFYMPFKDSARISFVKESEEELMLHFYLDTESSNWDENSLYFNAKWRVDHDLESSGVKPQDIPYIGIKGEGRLVGVAASLLNPTSVPSSWGNWWGEGDEKIYIDDHKMPRFIGTGSEDYFNYAWSSSAIFAHPYCGQPKNDGPANRGFVANYRWHIIDDLVFDQYLDFYMELYSHSTTPGFSYARTVYYYADEYAIDDHMRITKADLVLPEYPDNWQPDTQLFTRNAIFYQLEDLLQKGKSNCRYVDGPLWSGDKALILPAGTENIRINIPIPEDGNYIIAFTAAKMPGGGEFSVSLDGESLKLNGREKSNLSSDFRILSRNFKSDAKKMTMGMHELEIVPDPDKEIVLDFVWIVKW